MQLRREVGLWESASLSVGVMAPTLAMSVTGVAAASLLGRAAPLAFAFAAVGVFLVSYGFRRLSGEFASAGSVYAFVGNTLGYRAGFVTRWTLLGTYLVFPPVSIAFRGGPRRPGPSRPWPAPPRPPVRAPPRAGPSGARFWCSRRCPSWVRPSSVRPSCVLPAYRRMRTGTRLRSLRGP